MGDYDRLDFHESLTSRLEDDVKVMMDQRRKDRATIKALEKQVLDLKSELGATKVTSSEIAHDRDRWRCQSDEARSSVSELSEQLSRRKSEIGFYVKNGLLLKQDLADARERISTMRP